MGSYGFLNSIFEKYILVVFSAEKRIVHVFLLYIKNKRSYGLLTSIFEKYILVLFSAEKRIVHVFIALYYNLNELRPGNYHFCKVSFDPIQCRKAHSSRFQFRKKILLIFHISLKFTSKSPYVRI